jgi:hypothetical protein
VGCGSEWGVGGVLVLECAAREVCRRAARGASQASQDAHATETHGVCVCV